MDGRCIDMRISKDVLESHLVASGYWLDDRLRKRNAYVLSPAAYAVDETQYAELTTLARALYARIRETSARVVSLARSTRLTHPEAALLGLAKSGVRGLRSPVEHDGSIPPVIKVDLMEDVDGRYRIAEADVYNPRGFGYLALLDATIPRGFERVGGGMDELATMIARFAAGEQCPIIVSGYEGYYYPTYRILSDELIARSVHTGVLHESEIADKPIIIDRIRAIFSIPDTLYARPDLRRVLLSKADGGALRTFMPPAAYLGSKALLPIYGECPTVARYLPKTTLIGRRDGREFEPNGTGMLLKGVMSSGHKNIVFSRKDPAGFARTLAQARTHRHPQWIAQEEVPQQTFAVPVFDGHERVVREYYLRLTAYITSDGLLGLEVTGRQDGFVHGAPDCIQIPCVRV